MNKTESSSFSLVTWLIITIASIGFLFDTYELLMTPLVAAPAIAELLEVPISNPLVTIWVGRLLWIAAVCGGIFGLWGGWLVDRFGRKTIMAASIAFTFLCCLCDQPTDFYILQKHYFHRSLRRVRRSDNLAG
jgi:MFS family permease